MSPPTTTSRTAPPTASDCRPPTLTATTTSPPTPYKEPYCDNGDQYLATTDLSPANRVGSYAATDAAERKKHNHYNNLMINCDFIVAAITVRSVIGQ